MSTTWNGDWPQRLRTLAAFMGASDVYDLVMSRRGQSFGEVFRSLRETANELGVRVAFQQLKVAFYLDAYAQGKLREAFMEAMVRSIRQFLRKGWNKGKKVRSRRIDASTVFPTPSLLDEFALTVADWIALKKLAFYELEQLKPPDEWCPEDYKDPIIQKLFDKIWPVGADGAALRRTIEQAKQAGVLPSWLDELGKTDG